MHPSIELKYQWGSLTFWHSQAADHTGKGKHSVITSIQEETTHLQPPITLPSDSHGTIPAPSIVPLPWRNSPGLSRMTDYSLIVLAQIIKFK